MEKIIVLYICVDSTLGGSTASLYNLINSVKDMVYPIVLFPEEGAGYNFFVKQGIECYTYPFVKLFKYKENRIVDVWMYPWRWHYITKKRLDYRCFKYVKRILSGRKIAIVHSNTSPNDIGVYLSKRFKAKHIWHVREFCDRHFDFKIYRGLPRLRKLINQSDARIAISSAIKIYWKMPDVRTWVINDAVRNKRDACYVSEKKRYILFCSYYLTEAKGARNAVSAFGISGLHKDGYRLKLVGNCNVDYRKSLMGTAKDFACEDFVDFVPCQLDLKSFYANAAVFIMASEYEGLGRVTAEAMFYGCPVVAFASGGTLDLVKDGETGYLYNTVEECAEILRNVCMNNQEKVIRQALDFVMNNLSEEVYGAKIMEVYRRVLEM